MADVIDVGRWKIIYTNPSGMLTVDQLIDLEYSNDSVVFLFDITHLRSQFTFEQRLADDGNTYHWMFWTNPPEALFMGTVPRYFMINKREYIFTPRKVLNVNVEGNNVKVKAWGKFLQFETLVNFLKKTDHVPPFTPGKYFKRRLGQEEGNIRADKFLTF